MIVDNILEAALAFERNTGRKPRHVYLGRMEQDELRLHGREDAVHLLGTEADLKRVRRPEVHGLYVFVVDADSHLVVA